MNIYIIKIYIQLKIYYLVFRILSKFYRQPSNGNVINKIEDNLVVFVK